MRQFVLYCVFGGLGVLSDYLAFLASLALGAPVYVANIIGYAVGTFVSFFLNRRLNFKVLDKVGRRLATFLGVAAIGLLTSTVLLWLLVEVLTVDPAIAKLLTLPVVVVLQFSLNRLITFRQQPAIDADSPQPQV